MNCEKRLLDFKFQIGEVYFTGVKYQSEIKHYTKLVEGNSRLTQFFEGVEGFYWWIELMRNSPDASDVWCGLSKLWDAYCAVDSLCVALTWGDLVTPAGGCVASEYVDLWMSSIREDLRCFVCDFPYAACFFEPAQIDIIKNWR